jgi:hypothetical protein
MGPNCTLDVMLQPMLHPHNQSRRARGVGCMHGQPSLRGMHAWAARSLDLCRTAKVAMWQWGRHGLQRPSHHRACMQAGDRHGSGQCDNAAAPRAFCDGGYRRRGTHCSHLGERSGGRTAAEPSCRHRSRQCAAACRGRLQLAAQLRRALTRKPRAEAAAAAAGAAAAAAAALPSHTRPTECRRLHICCPAWLEVAQVGDKSADSQEQRAALRGLILNAASARVTTRAGTSRAQTLCKE